MKRGATQIWRKVRASARDTGLLFRQFAGTLFFFGGVILLAGWGYYTLAAQAGEPLESLTQSFYLMLTLTFFQANEPFPRHAVLQAFYFVMPLVGIGTLAQGLADFGYLLFNRRARRKEWEMAVASTLSNHTILVGLGHLGYRVTQQLHEMDEPVAVIELDPKTDLAAIVQGMGIPVIQDDATRQAALDAAGVARARTIVLCSQNDAMNLKIALKARSLKKDIRVVVRIFDDDFAQSLQEQFGFSALSATGMAAPAFAAAAAGADITRPISVEGHSLSLARIKLGEKSKVVGKTVGKVEDSYDLSVVLLKRNSSADLNPDNRHTLAAGDVLAVLGKPERIHALVHDSQ